MAGKNKVTRIAGASLAIALAGVTTLVPVAHAQSSLSPAPASVPASGTPAAPVAGTSTVAPVVSTPGSASAVSSAAVATTSATVKSSDNRNALAELDYLATRRASSTQGTGTANVKYASSGWEYTALAYNPKKSRLYAVSTGGAKGKPGHLLRIDQAKGGVLDLGEIVLEDARSVNGVTGAAFTKEGTLVLFEDNFIHTKDLSNDTATTPQAHAGFDKTVVLSGGNTSVYGNPLAWASNPDAADESELISTTVKDGKAYVWKLDVESGARSVDTKTTVDNQAAKVLGDIKTLDYAYTEGGTTTFADAEGRTVVVKGGAVTAANATEPNPRNNYVGVAALSNLAEASEAPTSVATAPADTQNSQVNEPASPQPSPATTTPTGTEWLKDLKVQVVTNDGKYPVQGVTFKVAGGTVVGAPTDRNGESDIQLQFDKTPAAGKRIVLEIEDAPEGYNPMSATITPDTDSDVPLRFELPNDPNYTTPNRARQVLSGINEAQSVISSVAKPLGAAAAIGGAANAGRGTSTRTTSTSTKTTDYTATRMTGRSTSATTGAASRNSNSGNSTGSARVVSSSTTTSASSYSERDDDLADTGTPMRAIISLGVIAMLIGAAYMALGRRREA